MNNSRIPNFFRLAVPARQAALFEPELAQDLDALRSTLNSGGLSLEDAASIVENVIGRYALPFSIATNFQINAIDRFVPMVVEEPSVVAAASNAAKMVRAGGGFRAKMEAELLIAQVELRAVADERGAEAAILAEQEALLGKAREAVPGLVRRGAGPRRIEVRRIGPGHLVVHILMDTADAMGANLANRVAEALGPRIAELSRGQLGLCILSNLSDERVVRVEAEVPFEALVKGGNRDEGKKVADAIEAASVFAERDPYRATTHNKGIMNGVDSVLLATGNDYRAVEAGAHAYAARKGTYSPLATWRSRDDHLRGELEIPLAVGIVGGTLRVHPTARLSLALSQIKKGHELAEMAAAAGLASNLAALRALSTDGILRGHMALHARSLAVLANAAPEQVDLVAQKMVEIGDISEAGAAKCLVLLRSQAPGGS